MANSVLRLFSALKLSLNGFANECGHAVRPDKRLNALALLFREPDFRFFDIQRWASHATAINRPLKVCQRHRISVPAY